MPLVVGGLQEWLGLGNVGSAGSGAWRGQHPNIGVGLGIDAGIEQVLSVARPTSGRERGAGLENLFLREAVNRWGGLRRISEKAGPQSRNGLPSALPGQSPLAPENTGELGNARYRANLRNLRTAVAGKELTNGRRQFDGKCLAPQPDETNSSPETGVRLTLK